MGCPDPDRDRCRRGVYQSQSFGRYRGVCQSGDSHALQIDVPNCGLITYQVLSIPGRCCPQGQTAEPGCGDTAGSKGGGLPSASLGLKVPLFPCCGPRRDGGEQAEEVLRQKLKTCLPSMFLLWYPCGWKPRSFSPVSILGRRGFSRQPHSMAGSPHYSSGLH